MKFPGPSHRRNPTSSSMRVTFNDKWLERGTLDILTASLVTDTSSSLESLTPVGQAKRDELASLSTPHMHAGPSFALSIPCTLNVSFSGGTHFAFLQIFYFLTPQ